MSSDRDSIVPLIDNLWYYGSVMSSKSCSQSSFPPSPSNQIPAALQAEESSLPLSTGGLSSPDFPFPETYLLQELESRPLNLIPYRTTQQEKPQMQDIPIVFGAMDDNHEDGELSGEELYPWMKKLGLQYREDGMIKIKPNHDDWEKTGNLESGLLYVSFTERTHRSGVKRDFQQQTGSIQPGSFGHTA